MVGRLSAGVARHRPGDGYAERCGMQKGHRQQRALSGGQHGGEASSGLGL